MKLFHLLLVLCFVLGVFCEVEVKDNQAREALARSPKVGLAWPYWKNGAVSNNNMWSLADPSWGSRVSWIYTWSVWNFPAAQQMGLEFVPMFWGEKVLNEFLNARNQGLFNQPSVKYVLGFNEPDLPGQALMSVGRAVELWRTYLQPLKNARPSLQLGAPAVTSSPEGKTWLRNFINQCTGCSIDFIPLHYYGPTANSFKSYVQDMRNTFGKNIWVTEFACAYGDCSQGAVNNFMRDSIVWLDSQSWVIRYSWFGALEVMPNNFPPSANLLLTSNGQASTNLGYRYASGDFRN